MAHILPQVRDYFHERLAHLKRNWKIFQSTSEDPEHTLEIHNDSDLDRLERSFKFNFLDEQVNERYKSEASNIEHILQQNNENKGFPSEFYISRSLDTLPDNRIPPSGIIPLPYEFKRSQIVTATELVPETGFHIEPRIMRIVKSRYPQYLNYVRQYVRPLGTTDATVNDFFKSQSPSDPIPQDRRIRIISLVKNFLAITPYLPVHFVDSLYDKTPLHTGTGYFNRHSFKMAAHALFSAPKEYSQRPTSKGYYINAFLELARTLIHNIKKFGSPLPYSSPSLEDLRHFFLTRPTMLFTRNHISDRDGNLKQRPVYAVDDLFIRIESMLTFPAHVLARKIDCCIMYGYETIRGSNRELDRIAQYYKTFFTIDWSAFDQRMPRVITDLFFTDFLESLIVISHGYQPTYDYPTYPDLSPEKMFQRTSNLLTFLHTWYNNMVFVTADGFAYARSCAGVPSGLLNTQYLDSFCNLFLIFDGLIEFGCSDAEIYEIFLLVMGDDNTGFTLWPITKLEKFIEFFERYALERYGCVLSKTKSVITILRNKIETLSYQCNFGRPIRPLGKLVAQLCYPERGPKPKYTSARAVGMAYAACGMDSTFHAFCRDIYYEYLDDSTISTDPDFFSHVQAHLPGYLRADESLREQFTLTEFPSLQTVIRHVSKWQGPLSFYPKWDRAHFINDPDVIPPSSITMAEFRASNEIPRPEIPFVWQ
jgi:hypothetical protein